MITYNQWEQNGPYAVEARGLSTDTKPTDVVNGSIFLEIDTGKIYMFSAEDEDWYEM